MGSIFANNIKEALPVKWNLHYALQEGDKDDAEGKNIKRIYEEFQEEDPEKAKEKAFQILRKKLTFDMYAASEGCEPATRYVVHFVLFDDEKNHIFHLKENGGNDDIPFLLGNGADECLYKARIH